jgi:DNA-binding CsgD family transcriptional regulator
MPSDDHTIPDRNHPVMGLTPAEALERGRACYERNEWSDAFEALRVADQAGPIEPEDLERLAWAAGLSARDDEMLSLHERVYHVRLERGDELIAARAAFWLGFRLLARGEVARASGWLGRAQRLVDQRGGDCAEAGYLLIPTGQRDLHAGDLVSARANAERAGRIGERFGDADLIALARNLEGRACLPLGEIDRGLALLDEAMLAATAGELSPVVTGLVYCTAIASCHRVFALERVREWTVALSSWCDANPQLTVFTGHCLVHRAEMLEISGAWPAAVAEAQLAVNRCVRAAERDAAGHAHYQTAEIHRLRGDFEAAEDAYREANREGFEPQPGLALLRLAQGQCDVAASASRRIVGAARDSLSRTRYLPAHVEIMLAAGDLDEARAATAELETTAGWIGTDVLTALSSHARAALALAEGDAQRAIEPLRSAFAVWQQIGAPFIAARLRVLLARSCAALGDREAARLELECAREVFERLGARPDVAAVDALVSTIGTATTPSGAKRGLTSRELEVLRLVACGKTNKAIARELTLSEKTVDRHVSNIFAKAGVATRAAATAFAYEHGLLL